MISVSRMFHVTLNLRDQVEVSLTEIEAKWLHREIGLALGISAASVDALSVEVAFDAKKFLEGARTALADFPAGDVHLDVVDAEIKYPSNTDQVQKEPETEPAANDEQIQVLVEMWKRLAAKDYDHDSERVSNMLKPFEVSELVARLIEAWRKDKP